MKRVIKGIVIDSDKNDWSDYHDHGDVSGDCYGYSVKYFRVAGCYYRMTTSRTGGNGIKDRIEQISKAELLHDYESCGYDASGLPAELTLPAAQPATATEGSV